MKFWFNIGFSIQWISGELKYIMIDWISIACYFVRNRSMSLSFTLKKKWESWVTCKKEDLQTHIL